MDRINQENRQIAGRLAEFYAGKTGSMSTGKLRSHAHSLSKLPNITQNKMIL
jgi:hypothetical protein